MIEKDTHLFYPYAIPKIEGSINVVTNPCSAQDIIQFRALLSKISDVKPNSSHFYKGFRRKVSSGKEAI